MVETDVAGLAACLKQHVRTENVGTDEDARIEHAAVVMRLGGEVHDGVDAVERLHDRGGVADVALHEGIPRIALDVAEVLEIARVRERVEIHDRHVLVRLEHVPDERRTDETGAAGHEYFLHGTRR